MIQSDLQTDVFKVLQPHREQLANPGQLGVVSSTSAKRQTALREFRTKHRKSQSCEGTWFEVVFVNLAAEEGAERHDFSPRGSVSE